MLGSVTPTVLATLAGIIVLLVVSTLVVWLVTRLMPQVDFAELTSRTRTWWVLTAVFCLATLLGKGVSLIFLALLSFLALKEYLSLIPTRPSDRAILLWAYAGIPIQTYLVATGRYELFIVFVPLYALLFVSTNMVLSSPMQGFLYAAGTVNLGMMLTIFGLGHVACLLVLPDSGNPIGGSVGLVVYLVFLVQFNDVAQYVAGKLMGRRKVIPKVSPNKTWEGLICGLLTTVALALLLAPFLTPLDRVEAIAAGGLIAAGGFAGDAMVSAIKRDLAVKDTGSLLPGHGGMLDRVDGLVFAAPLFFNFVHQIHY